jgi:hypothetical protein
MVNTTNSSGSRVSRETGKYLCVFDILVGVLCQN